MIRSTIRSGRAAMARGKAAAVPPIRTATGRIGGAKKGVAASADQMRKGKRRLGYGAAGAVAYNVATSRSGRPVDKSYGRPTGMYRY